MARQRSNADSVSSNELSAASDHGQLDEARRVAPRLLKVEVEAADVQAVDAPHRVEETLARQIAPDALQGFDEDAGVDVALEREVRRLDRARRPPPCLEEPAHPGPPRFGGP